MSLQFDTMPADEIEAEIDAVADLTEKVILTLCDGPRQHARSALECALAFLIAGEAGHDDERAADILRQDLFPSIMQLVDEECASPDYSVESVH